MARNLLIPTAQEEASPIEEALNLVRILAENSASGLASDAEALQRQSISQAELSNRLRAAIERAAEKSSESLEALRLAVCAFTVALRDEGITPEAVLVSLKAAIHSQTFVALRHNSTWNGPRLRETITTWCIQDYFRPGDCTEETTESSGANAPARTLSGFRPTARGATGDAFTSSGRTNG